MYFSHYVRGNHLFFLKILQSTCSLYTLLFTVLNVSTLSKGFHIWKLDNLRFRLNASEIQLEIWKFSPGGFPNCFQSQNSCIFFTFPVLELGDYRKPYSELNSPPWRPSLV